MRELEKLREAPHWSYSAISKFLNCQLAYYFQYVEKRKPEHTPVNLLFGSAFHAGATIVAESKIAGHLITVDEAQQLFSEYWREAVAEAENVRFKDGEDIETLDELGRKMIAVLYPKLVEEKIVAVAQAFSVPLLDDDGNRISEKPLIGEYDAVIKFGDEPVIVDWKTAARQWPADKAGKDLQATAFSYAWNLQHGSDPAFRFDVITKTKSPTVMSHPTRRSSDDYQRLLKLVSLIERAIAAEVFLPNEQSFCCSDCVYAGACSNWAGPARSVWVAPQPLPVLPGFDDQAA